MLAAAVHFGIIRVEETRSLHVTLTPAIRGSTSNNKTDSYNVDRIIYLKICAQLDLKMYLITGNEAVSGEWRREVLIIRNRRRE